MDKRKLSAREQRLNRRIFAALQEMGVIPKGPVAGPIRWQAVFFIGPAGSGKSFIRDTKYMRHLDFKVVDPDEIKKKHPDYDPDAPFKVHAWSKNVSKAMFKKIVEGGNGDPVIVDGTGRNAQGIVNMMKLAEENGYRTYIVYVYVPFAISIWRNRNRSRFVPEEVILEQFDKIQKSFRVLKSLADKSKVVPNWDKSEESLAKKDIALYPVPQKERPPRPGDSGYGKEKALAASDTQRVAVELLRLARQMSGTDQMDETDEAVEEYLDAIRTIERDIARARKELKRGQIGMYAAHLAHSLAGGQYADQSWYRRLFK